MGSLNLVSQAPLSAGLSIIARATLSDFVSAETTVDTDPLEAAYALTLHLGLTGEVSQPVWENYLEAARDRFVVIRDEVLKGAGAC